MSEPTMITEWGWTDALDESRGEGPSAWIDSGDLTSPETLVDEDGVPILRPDLYARTQAEKYGGRAYWRKVSQWTPIDGDNHVE